MFWKKKGNENSSGIVNPNATEVLNFIIVGGQRCGTTSLVHYLGEHPEIGFIWDDSLYHKGEYVGWPFASPILAHYQKGFDQEVYRSMAQKWSGQKKIIGTRQAYFMVFPHVPFGLSEQLPNTKLLFILRNQPDAIYSTWKLARSKGNMKHAERFEDAINYKPEDFEKFALPKARGRWFREFWVKHMSEEEQTPYILDRYFYYEQLSRYSRLFPKEQIMVMSFDEFKADTPRSVKKILGFLEVDDSIEITRTKEILGKSPKGDDMDPEIRESLRAFYADSNQRLFEFLGWPKDIWD